MKEGWAGIHVAPAMEFAACCEAQRLGLLAYCPQRRVRIWPKGVTEPLMRAYPLFKGYLLAPLSQARDRAWHHVQGVRGPKYLVVDAEGRPWTVEDAAVRELCQLERENAFDDPLPGNAVRLTGRDLLAAIAGRLWLLYSRPYSPPLCPGLRPKPSLSASFSRLGGRRLGPLCPSGSMRPGSVRRLRRTYWRGPRTTRSMTAQPLNVQPTLAGAGLCARRSAGQMEVHPWREGATADLSRAGWLPAGEFSAASGVR